MYSHVRNLQKHVHELSVTILTLHIIQQFSYIWS